jgi:hypothetical protein
LQISCGSDNADNARAPFASQCTGFRICWCAATKVQSTKPSSVLCASSVFGQEQAFWRHYRYRSSVFSASTSCIVMDVKSKLRLERAALLYPGTMMRRLS